MINIAQVLKKLIEKPWSPKHWRCQPEYLISNLKFFIYIYIWFTETSLYDDYKLLMKISMAAYLKTSSVDMLNESMQ